MSSSTTETSMVRRAGLTSDSWPTALATPIRQGIAWIGSRRRLRRDVKELMALDDRMRHRPEPRRVEYTTRRPRESAFAPDCLKLVLSLASIWFIYAIFGWIGVAVMGVAAVVLLLIVRVAVIVLLLNVLGRRQ